MAEHDTLLTDRQTPDVWPLFPSDSSANLRPAETAASWITGQAVAESTPLHDQAWGAGALASKDVVVTVADDATEPHAELAAGRAVAQEQEPTPPLASDSPGKKGPPPEPPLAAAGETGEPPDDERPRIVSVRSFQQLRAAIPVEALRHLPEQYDSDMASYERALSHPLMYQPTVHLAPTRDEDVPVVPDLLGFFYGEKRETHRLEAFATLKETGFSMISDSERTIADVIQSSQVIADSTGKLIDNLQAVHEAKATVPFMNQMSGPQRFAARQSLDAINSQAKSPVLAAYMRQYIPRYTWEPHSLPNDIPVPMGYQARFQELWSGYSPRDAGYLIHPDQLAQGMAPLHMAITAARTAEADGHAELGYALKTRLITDTLGMERARFQGSEHPEIPFFEYLTAAATTNEMHPTKGGHFDYSAAVVETLDQTWSRVEQETRSGSTGVATAFVDALSERYNGELSPYLAQSMVRYADRSTFDMVGTLRGLLDTNTPWASDLTDEIRQLPNRPILTNQEAGEFVQQKITVAEAPATTQVAEATAELLSDTDMYSFRVPVAAVATLAEEAAATVTVDITADEAQATIRYRSNGDRRNIPVTMNLIDGSVSIKTIDGQSLSDDIASAYKAVVGQAILGAKAKLDEATAAAQPKLSTPPTTPATPTTTAAAPVPVAERENPKVKTRGAALDSAETLIAEPAVNQPPMHTVISGLDVKNIAGMLDDQRILEVEPGTVLQKLQYLAGKAGDTGSSFGKRISLEGFRGGDRIKLRQVNWITGSGRQLRFYFLEGDGGRLELCGIYDKRGQAHQDRYLGKLVNRVLPHEPKPQKGGRR